MDVKGGCDIDRKDPGSRKVMPILPGLVSVMISAAQLLGSRYASNIKVLLRTSRALNEWRYSILLARIHGLFNHQRHGFSSGKSTCINLLESINDKTDKTVVDKDKSIVVTYSLCFLK